MPVNRYLFFMTVLLSLSIPALLVGQEIDRDEVVVITPQKMMTLTVEVAGTPEQWERGLKGVGQLEQNEGLLFLFPREGIQKFSTKDLMFPIDIVLINKFGRVVGIFEEASGDRFYASRHHIVAALEVTGGFCASNDITLGSFVNPKRSSLAPKAKSKPKEGELSSVEKALKENIRKNPDNPEVRDALASFYVASRKNEEAIKLLKEVLKKEETAPRLNSLGVALANSGEKDEAERQFRKAISIDPMFLGSYNNLLRLNLVGGGVSDAVAILEKAVEEHPDFLEGRLSLAKLYMGTGNFASAEALLEKAKEEPEAIRVLGDVYLRKGDHQKAANAYFEFLKARPYSPMAADLRRFVLVHKIKPEKEGK